MDDFAEDDFIEDDFMDEFDDPLLNQEDADQGLRISHITPPGSSSGSLQTRKEESGDDDAVGVKRLRKHVSPPDVDVSSTTRTESQYGLYGSGSKGSSSPYDASDATLSLEAGEYPYPVSGGEAPPFISPALLHFFLPNVPPTSKPLIVSVISQANIPCGVDLRDLGCAVRTAEYLPENRIASATLRLQHPDAVVVVRSSGALTIIGAHSVSESRQAAELASRIIRKALNLHFTTINFRVRSITARFNACSPVRLDALALHVFHPEESAGGVSRVLCHYEPERFNGCTIRMVGQSSIMRRAAAERKKEVPEEIEVKPSYSNDGSLLHTSSSSPQRPLRNRWCVSCVVYVTGKMTFLGARSQEELDFAYHAVIPIIAQYIGASNSNAGESSHPSSRKSAVDSCNTSPLLSQTNELQSSTDHCSHNGVHCVLPPSKESVTATIRRLREQWLRRKREMMALCGEEEGDWAFNNDEDEEMDYGLMNECHPLAAGRANQTNDGEDSDEDLDNIEDDDMGESGMDDF